MAYFEETDDIFHSVSSAYMSDAHFATLYHYESPTTYEEAAEFTTKYIFGDTPSDTRFFEAYVLEEKTKKSRTTGKVGVETVKVVIGFACLGSDSVWDLYINARYRATHSDFIWENIVSRMPDSFLIRLYENNFRDINWLIQNKSVRPVRFEKNQPGYYTGNSMGICDQKQEHTYFRNLSQIILNFTKPQPTW